MKLKQLSVILLLLAVFPLCLLSQQLVEVKVGVYQNKPKIYTGSDGKPHGIFIDILQEIAQKEHWKLEFVYANWSDLKELLRNGEIDLLPDMSYSVQRDSVYSLNKIPVIESWLEVFIRDGDSLTSIDELNKKLVGVLKGSIQEKFLMEELNRIRNLEVRAISFENYDESVQALKNMKVDAIVADRFFYYSDLCKEPVSPTNVIFRPAPIHFATTKNKNPDLLKTIDRHLVYLINDSKSVYYDSLHRWLNKTIEKEIPLVVKLLVVIFASLLLITIMFLLVLKNRVKERTKELQVTNNQLEQLSSFVKDIAETAPAGIYRLKTTGKKNFEESGMPSFEFIYFNNQFKELLSLNNTEIEQNPYSILQKIHPDDFDSFIFRNQEAHKLQQKFQWEGQFIVNQSVRWFHFESVPRTLPNGQTIWTGIVDDITHLKEVELELRKKDISFGTLAENSPVGIFRTRPDGYTTYVNPKWCELSGFSKEDALGFGWLNAVNKMERESVKERWIENIKSGKNSTDEYRFSRADGKFVWVLGNAIPEIVDGNIIGYIGTITDISERKQGEMLLRLKNEELKEAKNKAEESDKLKTAFLANISHEIRTPMNAICGFAQLLQITTEENRRREFTNLIVANSNELLKIINDLIDISTIETNQVKINESNFSINNIIDDIHRTFYDPCIEKGITFISEIGLSSPFDFIVSDEMKIKQVLNILLINALKSTSKGKIEFGYKQIDCCVQFHVTDTGSGIPMESQDIVFDKFRQVQNNIFSSRQGTGVGLSIAKAYVELLGGKIWFVSEENIGSEFMFTIPYKPGENTENAMNKTIKTNIDWSGKTILLVEDDHPSYVFLKCIVESTNAYLLWAKTGKEALDIVQKVTNIDLILLDIKLPDIDGIEVIKRIRSAGINIPVIAQTAYALTPDRDKAMDNGCNEYLTKPVHKDKLFELMAKYL